MGSRVSHKTSNIIRSEKSAHQITSRPVDHATLSRSNMCKLLGFIVGLKPNSPRLMKIPVETCIADLETLKINS